MKKEYSKPTMLVVELRHKCRLLQNSVDGVSSNVGLNYRGRSIDGDGDDNDEVIR